MNGTGKTTTDEIPDFYNTGFDKDGHPIGFFSNQDVKLYTKITSKYENGVMVEVGVWMGRSLSFIIPICKTNGSKIYAVDTWTGSTSDVGKMTDWVNETMNISGSMYFYECFLRNLGQIPGSNCVVPILGRSVDAAKRFKDESIDFIFIDSDHSYKAVKEDLETWWPKVKIGGALGGHDYHPSFGVIKAVDEFFGKKPDETSNSAWVVYKNRYKWRFKNEDIASIKLW